MTAGNDPTADAFPTAGNDPAAGAVPTSGDVPTAPAERTDWNVGPLTPDRYGEAAALWEVTGLTRPWNDPLEDIRRSLVGPASTVLACVVQDRLAATAMVGHDGHRGWVYYVAVEPGRRTSGLGRTMMAASERWLAERGAVKVHLMVRESNEQVIRFYEHLGYERSQVSVLAKWLP
ncbi:ribosomal protein S18 acetylase RimI-like enzyme [Arthrobacter sp. CAN_A212]|uniref:GNAT family acetyltransferase n=1 Tax=unclassified Arthrobacter TaxID=235627 RepID=UPI001A27AC40|nr:GNAT family acetyltransferase [Arthrobacter sp. CAN_C5]MBP2216509.1 ribosomal protein S18 acetylase RimI-like enzyme [Arthrobacter sp. CAN_C5]